MVHLNIVFIMKYDDHYFAAWFILARNPGTSYGWCVPMQVSTLNPYHRTRSL